MRRAALLVVLALATGILGYLVALRYAAPQLRVQLTNRTGLTVEELQLDFAGGGQTVGSLASGASWTKELVPAEESQLALSWLERPHGGEAIRRRELLDLRLTPGTSGRFEIVLREDGVVSFRGEASDRAAERR